VPGIAQREQCFCDTVLIVTQDFAFVEKVSHEGFNAELADAVVSLPSRLSLPRRSSSSSDERRLEPLIESLTTREHDVLALVADGLSNREIAHDLAISEHTVKFHLASIFGKLDVSTRTEAVQRGVRLGVIEI